MTSTSIGRVLTQPAEVILDAIGDAVLSTDADGLVTCLNLAAEAMTGWSREAATGRPVEDVFQIIDSATRMVARNPLNLAVQLDKIVGLTPNCLLVALAAPHHVASKDLHVSASLGISVYPNHGEDGETLIAAADRAMYAAKVAGGAHCRQFDPDIAR